MATSQVVPLPPLAEQHRIVAKVDELMALCDQLQAAQNEREVRRDRLVAASLHRISAAPATADEAETGSAMPTPLPEAARLHLAHLPRLTTRPEHIKQLRQTILNLAVRGHLVPQDTNDEPVAELFKRIATARVVECRRRGEIKEVESNERYFTAPEGWQWIRLGSAFSIKTGFAFKSSTYTDSGTLVFRVTNFDREGAFDLSNVKHFPTEQINEKFSAYLLEEGEIIMVMVGGTIGKTTKVTQEMLPALMNQNMWRLRSFGGLLNNDYEYLLIKSINQQIETLTHSTHGHFAMSEYEKKPICIPPLAEQHRIVAKVDELMALCDQLEAQLTTTQTDSRRLLEAVLHEALAA